MRTGLVQKAGLRLKDQDRLLICYHVDRGQWTKEEIKVKGRLNRDSRVGSHWTFGVF